MALTVGFISSIDLLNLPIQVNRVEASQRTTLPIQCLSMITRIDQDLVSSFLSKILSRLLQVGGRLPSFVRCIFNDINTDSCLQWALLRIPRPSPRSPLQNANHARSH